MTRVGAVDLGTNSTRLLVADVEDGVVAEIVRRSVITRLGEGVDARRRLLPVPIARVRNALSDFRRQLDTLGAERVLAVATSAVRDAENGEAFLGEIEWSYGFTTRLLTGNAEAQMTLRGLGATEPGTLVVDVGGGSTELSTDVFSTSLDIGSVRLTERFLASDPPTPDELTAARTYLDGLLPELEATSAIGVAGTVAQLEALGELTVDGVATTLARLAALPLAERRLVPGLDPDRAPVIVGGALIVYSVLIRYGLERMAYSVHDLLDGAALEAAGLPDRPEGDAPAGAYTCC